MDSYLIVKTLHVLAAFALVGPLMLTPRWLYLARHGAGQRALHDLHRLTAVSGWLVLISGGGMLFLQGRAMLSALWLQFSLAVFLAVQMFDHFWADRREDELEKDPHAPLAALKIWLMIKLGLYILITMLMVWKNMG